MGRERRARGDAPEAAALRYWDRVVAGTPTANPRLQSFSQERPPR